MHLAMQCSSILYILFEIKGVKYKLCESSSRIVGMKIPARAVCSSTHFGCNTSLDIVEADDDPALF